MLLSGSRWRRDRAPARSPEKARNQPVAQLAVAKRATAAASERAHDQMRSMPFRAGHSGMHIADCVTAPPIIIVVETG